MSIRPDSWRTLRPRLPKCRRSTVGASIGSGLLCQSKTCPKFRNSEFLREPVRIHPLGFASTRFILKSTCYPIRNIYDQKFETYQNERKYLFLYLLLLLLHFKVYFFDFLDLNVSLLCLSKTKLCLIIESFVFFPVFLIIVVKTVNILEF